MTQRKIGTSLRLEITRKADDIILNINRTSINICVNRIALLLIKSLLNIN